jgi:hypothetical protein
VTLDEYFAGQKESERLFLVVQDAIRAAGPTEMRITRSQVAFSRRTAFAWTWMPRKYLGARQAPLVLSLGLRSRIRSKRWKEVVQPRPGRYMHHLELWTVGEVDSEVRGWIRDSWEAAA